LLVKIRRALYKLGRDGQLCLEPLGRPEIRQQPILQRRFLRLIDDGIGFLGRHHEVPVLLHLQLGGFPPLLPIICDDIRNEDLLDLIKRGPTAIAVENHFDEIEMMEGGGLLQAFEVNGFARENVILGDRLEGFRREREIHRVAGFAGEINREPGEDRVHRLDAAKTPAAVRTKPAVSQLHEGFDLSSLDFSGRR
jgi:hypothetical protein